MTHSLPNFEQALAQLISTSSISSTIESWDQGNHKVISLMAGWFETLGFEVLVYPVPNTNNKYNLLAKLGSGDGGLLLAGHSDTVPFDENRWDQDPFTLANKNDRFYGLGTCDMKGFFAFILDVATALHKSGQDKKLIKPLYILATADEETTMAGARYFAEQQLIKPDVAIIGEPTNLTPVYMHKGHMSHRITVTGKSGHSSKPTLGVNAIEIMAEVIQTLMSLKQLFASQFNNSAFDVPTPTLNLGAIKGGDSANRICGECFLDIDMRALPGIKDEELIFLLNKQLEPIAQKYAGRLKIEALHLPCPSFAEPMSKTKPSFHSIAEELSGHSCCVVDYCTEAPFIQSIGTQTLILGPGSIDQAHQPNEFLECNQIASTLQILTDMINRYCLHTTNK